VIYTIQAEYACDDCVITIISNYTFFESKDLRRLLLEDLSLKQDTIEIDISVTEVAEEVEEAKWYMA